MRVMLLDIESSAIAGATRSSPAASPAIRRRTAMSVAQTTPFARLPMASCQISSVPARADAAISADVAALRTCPKLSSRLRSIASASAPAKAPAASIGSARSIDTNATASAEPVTENT